jgi:hypothetical protein
VLDDDLELTDVASVLELEIVTYWLAVCACDEKHGWNLKIWPFDDVTDNNFS